jgi:hypothetical protein
LALAAGLAGSMRVTVHAPALGSEDIFAELRYQVGGGIGDRPEAESWL